MRSNVQRSLSWRRRYQLVNGSVAARESTISTTNQQIMKDSHYIDRWTVPEILDGKPLAVYHAGCSRPGFRPDEKSGMKANQKGEHSPYDFARRAASCGTEPLRYQGHATLLFPRTVEYGILSGRSDIEICQFYLRSACSRYGTCTQQHGNGT